MTFSLGLIAKKIFSSHPRKELDCSSHSQKLSGKELLAMAIVKKIIKRATFTGKQNIILVILCQYSIFSRIFSSNFPFVVLYMANVGLKRWPADSPGFASRQPFTCS